MTGSGGKGGLDHRGGPGILEAATASLDSQGKKGNEETQRSRRCCGTSKKTEIREVTPKTVLGWAQVAKSAARLVGNQGNAQIRGA